MEKRYESDMTRKEKWEKEIKKLKAMSFKEKVEHIFTYYKPWFATLAAIIVVIYMGVQMYEGSKEVELLSIAVVDSMLDQDGNRERLQQDLLEFLGTGDKYERVPLDTSATSIEDYGAMTKMMVVMASGTTDILISSQVTYDHYKAQDAFLSWEDVLGDEYSKYEQYMTDGAIDLSKCPKWETYNLTYYKPVYATVVASTKRPESCAKFVEFITQE